MKLSVFIKEILDPHIKCERVGHDMKDRHRAGYYSGGGFRTVATKVTQRSRACDRCGHQEGWVTIDEQHVQSLSADTETMFNIRNSDSNNPHWTDFR